MIIIMTMTMTLMTMLVMVVLVGDGSDGDDGGGGGGEGGDGGHCEGGDLLRHEYGASNLSNQSQSHTMSYHRGLNN